MKESTTKSSKDRGHHSSEAASAKAKFVSSKWEEIDPEKLEKQAITTSKWDFFDAEKETGSKPQQHNLTSYGSDEEDDAEGGGATENGGDDEGANRSRRQENGDETHHYHHQASKFDDDKSDNDGDDDEDIDGEPMEDDSNVNDERPIGEINKQSSESQQLTSGNAVMDEEKRKMLREIEVKIVKYIDEIESGKVKREEGLTIQEQAEKYRQELIKKVGSLLNTNISYVKY